MNWLKYYMPAYLILYLLTVFVLPTWRVYRQTAVIPVTFGKTDSAHDFSGRMMKWMVILLSLTVVLFTFGGGWYRYLVPVCYLQVPAVQWAGLILVHAALLWTCIAQYQMRDSWRIGIDRTHPGALVTHGVFSLSRNPVFLGMICGTAGVFLILPNAMTFFITGATWLLIQVQIRLEEAFLQETYGEAYRSYQQKTKRLI